MICRVRTAKKRSNSVLQGTKKRDSLSMRCATPSSTAWPSQAKFGVHAALIACCGCRLATGLYLYQKFPMISEQVRQPTIRYHADCKRTPDCIVSSARHLSGRLCPKKLVGMLSRSPGLKGFRLREISRLKRWPIAASMVTIQKRFVQARSTEKDRTARSVNGMESV